MQWMDKCALLFTHDYYSSYILRINNKYCEFFGGIYIWLHWKSNNIIRFHFFHSNLYHVEIDKTPTSKKKEK